MKFLIDAQLPIKLSQFLVKKGFDSIHTLELPDKNKTKDSVINRISIEQTRVVISKDSDFYNSYFRRAEPYKLIYLSVGNISTNELIDIFDSNYEMIFDAINNSYVVEVNIQSVISII